MLNPNHRKGRSMSMKYSKYRKAVILLHLIVLTVWDTGVWDTNVWDTGVWDTDVWDTDVWDTHVRDTDWQRYSICIPVLYGIG